MKIAVWHNLPSGGGKRALHDQVRGLTRRGHHVEIWCPPTADRTFLPLSPFATERVLPMRWHDASLHANLVEKARWALLGQYRNLAELDSHCRRCGDEINRGGFDLLLAHASAGCAVSPIAHHVRIPRVLYLPEPERMLYEAMPRWPWIPPRLSISSVISPARIRDHFVDRMRLAYFGRLAREESRNVQAFDRVLANSLFSRESILRAYGVDACVSYLGVDIDRFMPHGLRREGFAVGVGSFTPAKNVEFVVRAFARIPSARPRLVWIGNTAAPGYLERLQRLAASSQVELEVHQGISDETLVDLLNRAAMMVYAPRLEPFGYTPLEANACGLPVVAVAEGGIRETVTDGVNGLLVESDLESMARAVERLRDDEALSRKLGEGGRRVVEERWSLDAAVDRLERRLHEVLERVAQDHTAGGRS